MTPMKKSPAAILLAATAALATQPVFPAFSQSSPQGGFQEWTTDQEVDDEAKPDAELKAFKQQAEQEEVCVPIGEGENCW